MSYHFHRIGGGRRAYSFIEHNREVVFPSHSLNFFGEICLQLIGTERDAYMAKLKAPRGRKLGF